MGGLPEIVKPDETGWLAEPGDVAGFTGHVAGIWSDPARARRIVEQARAFAQDNFQLGRKMDETLRAYEVAIRRKREALRRDEKAEAARWRASAFAKSLEAPVIARKSAGRNVALTV